MVWKISSMYMHKQVLVISHEENSPKSYLLILKSDCAIAISHEYEEMPSYQPAIYISPPLHNFAAKKKKIKNKNKKTKKNVMMAWLLLNLDSLCLLKLHRKFPEYSDTQKICCNHSKIWTMWLYHWVMSPNDADGMANSADTDQAAPLEAVWSGSALFAQAYLSENLGSLQ